jgi:hypothetical protein
MKPARDTEELSYSYLYITAASCHTVVKCLYKVGQQEAGRSLGWRGGIFIRGFWFIHINIGLNAEVFHRTAILELAVEES